MKFLVVAVLAFVGFSSIPASEAKAGVVIDLGGPVIVIGGGNRYNGCGHNNYNGCGNGYGYGYNGGGYYNNKGHYHKKYNSHKHNHNH
ncbi:MAG: hypothetical protein ACAI35_15800 [Candidatus Methylacidiphilales bacterium]|nr:hypothetical protein [Candidatus Methylacidiphilales bacterium]